MFESALKQNMFLLMQSVAFLQKKKDCVKYLVHTIHYSLQKNSFLTVQFNSLQNIVQKSAKQNAIR